MSKVPKVVFIVPYRNRPQHKYFFSNYLKTIMDESDLKDNYEVYFSHQHDERAFNRGATKNIGFLAVKNKYPNDYKNITFIFNDIDTIPFTNIFKYETVSGIVKHFYGFDYSLGGIVSINGSDFEKINGFPNFWGWGMEDTVLQKRCENQGITIDRSQFFSIGDPNILHLFDGVQRIINQKDPWKATRDDGIDGLLTIHKLKYDVSFDSSNQSDNIHMIHVDNIFIVNIEEFMTGTRFENDNYIKYDLREPTRKIINSNRIKTSQIDHTNNDWSKIPFYPTIEKKNEMIQKYGKLEAERIIKYSYENSTDPTREVIPPQQSLNLNSNDEFNLNKIQQYNEAMRQINSSQRIIPQNINKFSSAYTRIIASKPKATTSANIRLGGLCR